MSDFKQGEKNKIRRIPNRGHYDKETIYEILDDGIICNISFIIDDQPFIIPTAYARVDDVLYVHGAKTSRMINQINRGLKICFSVTHLDGYVLARSAFHHSMNYRSVVVFGTGKIVNERDEKILALKVFSEHLIPGRWEDVRKPNEKELNATNVLKITIDEASAKIRTGPAVDDKEDYDLDVWAGVLPFKITKGELLKDELLKPGISVPDYLKEFTTN